ncbi:hypothetical protein H4R26_000477 [Coemansia thaxteri]|uniref:Uncharacterized protein n=1 Tax=Coemansia thaxteri TaxID=2663907 RepID=A0A9W8BK43_9FUNG|nr:hypothetical protein H4R26_000477 [Coemansia thaxteri]KAJ2484726.1 hypothetical protein EV174_002211 [Coemansia sp. RSA 2320]
MAGCPQERDDELSGGFEDDDFGGFGEEADEFGAEADEFGDFGSASPEVNAIPTIAADSSKPRGPPSIEAVLAQTSTLFGADRNPEDNTAALSECLAQIFGSPTQSLSPLVGPGECSAVLAPSELECCITRLASTSDTCLTVKAEPRLLQNILVVALAAKLPDSTRTRLLTPLSELSIGKAQPAEAPPEIAMLDIDKVRQIAGDSEETAPALLSQALHTVNALIADKEREVAKRRDAVLAYNQVIQTLVAQAAKLH